MAADGDQDVARDAHVQHFLHHDAVDQLADFLVVARLQREHRGQIGRNGGVLQFHRVLQVVVQVGRGLGGADAVDDAALQANHGLFSSPSTARLCAAPGVAAPPRSAGDLQIVQGHRHRVGVHRLRRGRGGGLGRRRALERFALGVGHLRMMARLSSDRSRVTGMWLGSLIGSENASLRMSRWRTTES